MATETTSEATAFDPRKPRRPARAVGSPPPRPLPMEAATVGEGSGAVTDPAPMALVAVPVGEGSGAETSEGERLPGIRRRPGSREIHVTLSEKAYRLLETARAENPATSYGDLVAAALVQAKPALLADRPAPPEDPLLRPARAQRLHVEGRTRSRPFNVTPAQADAIRALAEEVGIPNLSELVDRSVVLAYGTDAVPPRR
ncbi:MAG TPA: hypothetical protein VFE55_05995 [Acidimicrobiia bacterium]|nr:hypothetical protein [Acidimicrobiia bacterium]